MSGEWQGWQKWDKYMDAGIVEDNLDFSEDVADTDFLGGEKFEIVISCGRKSVVPSIYLKSKYKNLYSELNI